MTAVFFRNAAFLTVVEVLVRLKGVIVLPLLTRYLGAESFGIWSQTAVIAATLSPLIVLGTDSAALRYLPGLAEHDQQRFFSAWILALSALTTLVAILLFTGRGTVATLFLGNSGFSEYVSLAALMLLTTLLLNCARNWFRIRNETRTFGVIAVAQAILSLLALIVGMMQDVGLAGLILYTVLADGLTVIGCLVLIGIRSGFASPDFSIITKLLTFGLPLVPAGFAMWGLNYMDRLFLAKYSSLEEIGIYSFAYQLGYIAIQLLVTPIWTMYASTAAELHNQGETEAIQRLFNRSAGAILTLALPAIVGLFVLGHDVLTLLATPGFLPGAPLMSIVALGYLCLMLAAYYEVSLGLAHRQYLGTLSMAVAFLVNMAGNALLIPYFMITGAAIATAIGFASQLAFSMTMASRYKLIQTDFRFLQKALLASVVMGVLLSFFDKLLSPGLPLFLLKILLGAVIFLILSWVVRILPSEFIALLMRRARHG